MKKRAVDLSLEELAAIGANAALGAANQAHEAGLLVSGSIDFIEDGQAISTLAERHPSGTVTLLGAADGDHAGAGESGAAETVARRRTTH